MSEINTNHGSIFNSHRSNSVSRPVRSLYTKEKTMIHLNRLKSRVGIETHVAHPRPFRDVSSLKKDFDTALDATRKIQTNRTGLLIRRQKPDNCSTAANSSLLFDDHLSSRANTLSILKARESERYPMNNHVFKTIWEKIFIPKNAKVNTITTEESMREDLHLTENKANFSKRSTSTYFGDNFKERRGRRESNYECTESLLEDLGEKDDVGKEKSKVKKDLLKALERCKVNSEKEGQSYRGSFLGEACDGEKTRFKIGLRRGLSTGNRELGEEVRTNLKYESELKKNFIIKMKYRETARTLGNTTVKGF